MQFNFDESGPRRGTHSIKWDTAVSDDTLPMWIADMDFRTFPAIVDAVSVVAAKGHFGYNKVPDSFNDAIISWWQKLHLTTLEKAWILPATGVIAGISATVTAYVRHGDEIIIQTPAYNHFFNVIRGCHCTAVENPLIYKDGTYTIDFEDLELKASSEKAKILLFCNPHNPVGRAWTEQELVKIAAICSRHNILVISDEIHADLVLGTRAHNPFISAANMYELPTVTCSSASKTFNLSGLHSGYLIVKNFDLRKIIEKQLWAQASGSPSLIACEALTIAYTHGSEWLAELNQYLHENYEFLKRFLAKHLSNISVVPLEATYLVWLDCSNKGIRSADLARLLLEKENLWLNSGLMYGTSGEGFLRMNIACPRKVLHDGLDRLANVLSSFTSQ